MKTHYLFPGKLAAFKEETLATTLLGSCVAVALHDPEAKVGGLNHYLLPLTMENEIPNPRYGDFAIKELVSEVEKIGGQRSRMVAKIYGGANVLSGTSIGEGIGKRNIEQAQNMLRDLGIKIVDSHVGGESARTIKFNSSTFDVKVNVSGSSEEDSAATGSGAEKKTKVVDISGFRTIRAVRNVKVLVVDDSATVRSLFTNIFTKAGLEVVGAAADPYQAREMLVSKKPDVLTLDIEMPRMSGVQFLEKIMKHSPLPVVMVSSLGATGEAAMRALELGAVEFVHKPSQFDPAVLKDLAGMLVDKIKAAATVNVIKKMKEMPKPAESDEVKAEVVSTRKKYKELKVVVVGGNSGSPEHIEKFVSQLANDTPPVVVACSTIANFADAYIAKLKSKAKVTLAVAKDGDFLRMGTVYFISAAQHGRIEQTQTGPVFKIDKSAPVSSQLPSANVLFKSAAQAYGGGVYGILFGGFGVDGVDGLEAIQGQGGFTVAHHPEETSMPFGPQKAIEVGVAEEILRVDSMAKHLMDYRNQSV